MSKFENMIDECLDLTTVIRPFLVSKRAPIIMTTLCILTAEAIVNKGSKSSNEEVLVMVDKCIRTYVQTLEESANDPA